MALACYDFLKKYGGAENTRIKWPNDLYWQDRKAGGILIEGVLGGSEPGEKTSCWRWAIVGIGININQTFFSDDLPNPVSLKQITGKSEDVLTLARELCTFIQKRYSGLNSSSPKDIIREYNSALYKLNQSVKLKKGNTLFETTILGVSTMGTLLTKDVMERAFNFGEVEWIGGK
jgi:BirA family biotin operon repressor/biotin-[acetyl-CoA-carboxylase] ligase